MPDVRTAVTKRQRRYAFVGTGHRAELYFAALLGSHADVGVPAALCDVNPTRMGYYQRLWREARPDAADLPAYDAAGLATMLEREDPDAVIVTSIDSTHARYVTAALERGCDVVCEKPLTIDVEGCRAIVAAAERGPGELIVTFNYRYSPRNSAVKQLLCEGAIGTVTSLHFEWLLDTVHGADYFRRWHRDKDKSGGLMVHKATHHFDLVNWWVADVPDTVTALAHLCFYGIGNARRRRRSAPRPGADPFAIDLAADERLRALYVEARTEDGYARDRDVFSGGISIEDNMGVLVGYEGGAMCTYSLNAHAPWEGYRVGINGTEGRLELSVCERPWVEPGAAERVVGWGGAAEAASPDHDEARRAGTELIVQRHWERARRVAVEQSEAGHGGGDARLLDDVFRRRGDEPSDDPLGRRAGYRDGVRSALVGIAANRSAAIGQPVRLADLGVAFEGGCLQPSRGAR